MRNKCKIFKRGKRQSGITLVALVVTIVVLLILAGVSLSLVLNNNGIIDKAKEASEKTKKAQLEEQYELEDMLSQISSYVPSTAGFNTTNSSEVGKQVNSPKITKGMIPIKWDTEKKVWVVCSQDDAKWYSYDSSKKWANIMLSDGKYKSDTVEVGQEVADEDLGSMYVWIPRYAYKIEGTKNIKVYFLKGNTNEGVDGTQYTTDENTDTSKTAIVHPAFTNSGAINGIWVAKFEASGTDKNGNAVGNASADSSAVQYATDDTTIAKSLPNKISWRHISIGDSETRCIAITTSAKESYGIDYASSHLIKNSEWGAVAYLCYSDYGSVPMINGAGSVKSGSHYYNLYTGAGPYNSTSEARYGITDGKETNGGEFTKEAHGYSTANGILASTTGNVTGIYDMNGGAWERVAAYLDNSNWQLSNYASQYFENNELKSEYSALWDKYEVSEEEKKGAKTAAIEIEENGTKEYITQGQLWDANKIDKKYQVARYRLTKATFDKMASHKGIGVNEVSSKFSFYAPYYTSYTSETENTKSWSWFQDPEKAAGKPGDTKGGYATTWDGDLVLIGHVACPFVMRGGVCSSGSNAGVLCSSITGGYPNGSVGFRSVLVL